MVATKEHVVWAWIDDDNGRIKYIGWGKFKGIHPATELYGHRHAMDSDLGDWLQILPREPRKMQTAPYEFMHRIEARTIAVAMRQRAAAQRVELLSAKNRSTRAGGGGRRRVQGPRFSYDSVREAAICNSVDPSTMTRWCAKGKNGFSYI